LELLLAEDFAGRAAFVAQLDAAEVVGGCGGCPCPSIELRVDHACALAAPHDPTVGGHVPLPSQASAPGGDLILFHDKGWIAYLEYAAHDPDDLPMTELPEPAQLDVYTLPLSS
jgi:hypothetical protein